MKEDIQTTSYLKRCSTSLSKWKCKPKPQWNNTIHPSEWLKFKSLFIGNFGDVVEQLELLLVGMLNGTTISGKGQMVSFKTKQAPALTQEVHSNYSREIKTYIHKKMCTRISIAALIHDSKKLVSDGIIIQWKRRKMHNHTVECYSTIRRNYTHHGWPSKTCWKEAKYEEFTVHDSVYRKF